MSSVSVPAARSRTQPVPSAIDSYADAAAVDQVCQVSTARAFLTDHARLQADFPQLRQHILLADNPELRTLAEPARTAVCRQVADRWLVASAAVVSGAQVAPEAGEKDVNTSIVTTGQPRGVRRPPRYGRACIAEVSPVSVGVDGLAEPVRIRGGGELDLKGVGVATGRYPIRGDYSDGLLALREALQEYVVGRLLDEVFTHGGAAVRALPQYGVIDTGFDGFTAAGVRFPAGILVRRAHVRDLESDLPRGGSEEERLTIVTELLLRRYGLSSSKWDAFVVRKDGDTLRVYSGDTPTEHSHALVSCLVDHFGFTLPFVADRINIQMDAAVDGTAVRQVLDFGHYGARSAFDRALVSPVRDRPMTWGGMLLPTDDCYVQPDPALAMSGRWWREACRPRAQLFGEFAAGLVESFRRRELDHEGVWAHTAAMLEELTSGWPSVGLGDT